MGSLLAALVLLIFVGETLSGEGLGNPFKLKARELFLMTSFLITLAGIVLALWWQGIGGLAMIAGMVAFIGKSHQWLFYAVVLID